MNDVRDGIDIPTGLAHLSRMDAGMARLIERLGPPPPRSRPAGFAALLNIMVAQQVSTASAAAIWKRLETAGMTSPTRILEGDEARLRELGLSRPKARYAHALAAAAVSGALDLDALPSLPDARARAHLLGMLGIGPWTADIYLLFCLNRVDIFPCNDLALQEAARALLGLEHRPSAEAMSRIAAEWSPWRGVAALVLWRYYKELVGREA